MTEKEKMLAEKWYDANFDQDLINERARAKDICFELNHTRPSDTNKRKELIDQLFQTTTDNVELAIPFDTDYGWNVKLGKNVFVNTNCYFMDGGELQSAIMFLLDLIVDFTQRHIHLIFIIEMKVLKKQDLFILAVILGLEVM